MTTLNLNTSPYFDDYQQQLADGKDYVRVLFRPGFAVQARELTQLQSMMQEQVTRFGNHIFKDGSIVKDGEIKFINDYDSITIDIPAGRAIADYNNRIITGDTTGIRARVLATDGVNRLFLRYLSEGILTESTLVGTTQYAANTTLEKFIYSNANNADFTETLNILAADNAGQTEDFTAELSGVGFGSAVSVVGGVYYIDGIFTRVPAQTLILDINDSTPSFRVGFELQSSVVTSNEDSTLVDNSRGTTNTGAPGANRLENKLLLAKRDLNASPDEIFIEIVRIENGIIQEVLNNPQYADLLTTFARRTFDESGNYALDPFLSDVKDDVAGDTTKFNLSLTPSKAYVQGYEIETVVNTNVSIGRARDTLKEANFKQALTVGNWLDIELISGSSTSEIPFNNDKLYLRDSEGSTRGYARVRGFDDDNNRLYIYDTRLFVNVPVNNNNANDFVPGDVIRTQRGISGTVVDFDNDSDVGRSDFELESDTLYLTNVSGTILNGDTITSQTNSSVTTTVSGSTTVYSFGDNNIDRVGDHNNSFSATIIFTNEIALQGGQGSLVFNTQKEIQTATFGNSKDNDFLAFSVDTDIGGNAEQQTSDIFNNGRTRVFRIDDGDAISKTLRYGTQIHTIHRDTDTRDGKYQSSRTRSDRSVNTLNDIGYGWALEDRDLNLQYPDIYRVHAIYDSLDPTVSPIADRLNLQTAVTANTFLQGDVITGVTSGAEAIVIRENRTGGDIESTTNNNHIVEVLITKGAFNAGEGISSGTDKSAILNTSDHITKTSHVNIISSYNLDDGQRLDYYDLGRLVRKSGVAAPQGQVMVFVSRWALTSPSTEISNHYYNVDSYLPADDDNFFNTDPRFNTSYFNLSTPEARIDGVNLRNAIDFRRRVESKEIADNIFTTNAFSFTDRTFFNQSYVVPNSTFTIEFDYYLPRRDKVVLNEFGDFVNLVGISDEDPRYPAAAQDVMTLNTIDIPAYTRYVEDVTVNTINNRRYTMRDIGNLDTRLRNVETAISLTALESNVFNSDIVDEFGLQRFKSGFVTDDFVNTQLGAGDFTNPEFNVVYNDNEAVMQPAVVAEMWRMKEQNPNAAARTTSHYVVNGGLATLPYDEVIEISQTYATECLRINPHAVWIFGGEIVLTPSSDFWDEIVNIEPRIISYQDIDGNTIEGPFTIDQVPENVRDTIELGRPVRTVGTEGRTVNETRDRIIGSSSSQITFNVDQSFRRDIDRARERGILNSIRNNQNVIQATVRSSTTTTETITSVRQATTRDITSSRIVDERIIRGPRTPDDQKAIRGQIVRFDAIDFKPNTEHFMFFDGVDISGRIGGDGSVVNRTTDDEGSISSSFSINLLPGDNFLNGVRVFEMRNSNRTSSGSAKFTAAFFESTRQNDIVSTRSVIPAGRILSESSTVNSVTSRTILGVQRGDPIAESFFVDDSIFLTSIDIRMCVIDPSAPNHIELEIRNMVNGYPGTFIVPGGRLSRTITEMNRSTFAVNADGSHSTTPVDIAGDETGASNFTRLTFKNPIYLEGGTDYCFVLKTPSPITSVWTAVRGGTDVVTNEGVDNQPYIGSSFVSQNNITWSAEQNRDITFVLNRAEFDVSRTGTLTLENDTTEINSRYNIGINNNRPGLAIETDEGSNYVTVHHPNHSMYDTASGTVNTVEISGVQSNIPSNSTFNGIPVTLINSEHPVLRPTLDTYQIRITDDNDSDVNAASTGAGGGTLVQASQNWQYDKLTTAINTVAPDGTDIASSYRTISGTSLWLALDGNSIINAASTTAGGISNERELQPSYDPDANFSNFTEEKEFDSPRLLTNSLNNGVASSLFIRMALSSTSQGQSADGTKSAVSRISPVIDLASNNGLYGAASIVDNNVRQTATGLTQTADPEREGVNLLVDGTSSVSNGATPPSVILSMNHTHRSITDSEVETLTNLLDNDPDRISYHKQGMYSNIERTAYITNEVTLANEADRITVIFDVDADPGNDIRIWIKTSGIEDDTPLGELDWVELSNTEEFPLSRPPINNDVDNLSSSIDFTEFTFDSGDNEIPSFNSFAIRITIDTENEAEPPKFANFRAIVTA